MKAVYESNYILFNNLDSASDVRLSQLYCDDCTKKMSGDNHSKDVTNFQVQLISTLMKLAKKDIPVAAVWYHDKEAKMYGTKFLKGLITNLEKADV